ncbi:AraC family transcriptional regulator [Pedobacter changchengzhani]|nr:AraC family transcriptional regulator [Pedobacter changchengzhani]
MHNFYKYFPSSDKGCDWGLNVLSVGCSRVLPNEIYPNPSHPSHHNFTWEMGRVLQEYALVYIVNGTGILETETLKEEITDGTVFMIFPDERHRYKPDNQKGWDEYWISFNGDYIEKLIEEHLFSKTDPMFQLGFNEQMLQLFASVVHIAKDENKGYQAVISSATIHILGILHGFKQQQNHDKDSISDLTVKKAKILFRHKVLEITDPKAIADELEVGYSWFRKVFKENTGISPGQYFIQLKTQKAKELLVNQQYSIKEIAYILKFESPFYFSKLFKQKTLFTPLQFRKKFAKSDK